MNQPAATLSLSLSLSHLTTLDSATMADLEQLELLGLVNSITQELVNHTGLSDSTLAEFLIHLHTTSSDLTEFKLKCSSVGAEFPASFLESVDRLVLSMHPKYKLKSKSTNGKGKKKKGKGKEVVTEELNPEKEKAKRLFPGLSLPDQEWVQTTEYQGKDAPKLSLEDEKERQLRMGQPVDVLGAQRENRNRDETDLGIDGLMKELEGVSQKKRSVMDEEEDSRSKRSRQRSPDYDSRGGGGGGREERGRDRYREDDRRGGGFGREGRVGGVGPNRLDEKPVLYKIYPGKVSNIKDFGCFVALEGIVGRQEGKQLSR